MQTLVVATMDGMGAVAESSAVVRVCIAPVSSTCDLAVRYITLNSPGWVFLSEWYAYDAISKEYAATGTVSGGELALTTLPYSNAIDRKGTSADTHLAARRPVTRGTAESGVHPRAQRELALTPLPLSLSLLRPSTLTLRTTSLVS